MKQNLKIKFLLLPISNHALGLQEMYDHLIIDSVKILLWSLEIVELLKLSFLGALAMCNNKLNPSNS